MMGARMPNELAIVFQTELLRKLRSRIFWFATLGGVLAIAFIVEAPVFFTKIATSSTSDIVLAGPPALRERARTLLDSGTAYHVVASVAMLPSHVTMQYLDSHGRAGAAVAVSVRGDRLHLDVFPRDLSAFDDVHFNALVPLNIQLQTGVAPARARRAATIERSLHAIDTKFSDSRTASVAHGIAFGLIFMLYLAIILASQSVMAAVAEEKTNRIAEILVSTIAPANLLAGKTLSAAVIALVQIGVWIATGAVLLPQLAASLADPATAHRGASDASVVLLAINPAEVAAFFLFFVLGYLQYATIYAAAASLISRTEDLASVTTPVILPVVGAFFVAQFALLQPNAPVVVACSFVPFLSPFVMFTRIAISTVPWWQTGIALAINAATVVFCFWAAGKIYRIGMLLYGKVPSLKQVVAALRM